MASAAWTFSKTCLTTIHYDEWDVRDPAPVLTELRAMAAAVKRRTLG
jgi:hypothetical protein